MDDHGANPHRHRPRLPVRDHSQSAPPRHAPRRSRVEATDALVAAAPPADELAIQRDDADRVRRALAELDEDDRAALWMRVDGELTYDDIAAALEISAGAARVRVHRARRRLLERIRLEETKHEQRDP